MRAYGGAAGQGLDRAEVVERVLTERPPPMRPLVYTEAPPEEEAVIIEEAALRYISPEDLALAVYQVVTLPD